jgi:hypothetical protein
MIDVLALQATEDPETETVDKELPISTVSWGCRPDYR